MSSIVTRGITGFFFVMIIVLAVVFGNPYMYGLFGVTAIFMLYEFYNLFNNTKYKPSTYIGIFIGVLFYALTYYDAPLLLYILLVFLTFPVLALVELFKNNPTPFQNISITITGILYIIFPFIILTLLRASTNDYWLVLSIFIMTWTSDTFAYLIGRKLGKHKLFERISPNKSWEGFIGGLLFSIVAGFLIAYFTEHSIIKFMAYGLLIGLFGTLGDLIESMLKRSLKIKDSGNILPGHGGLLDRFDALLLVIPIIYCIELLIN